MKKYLVRIKIDFLTENLEFFKTLKEAKAYTASVKHSTIIEKL